jgi:tetratricopeptide (TPR) repeat protein
MAKRRKADALIQTVERALDPGRFVSYSASSEFVQGLEEVKGNLEALVEAGEVERAVHLYELFLAGCYEKAEEIDDSGGTLGQFFGELFVSWIKARQKAGYRPEETVNRILRWMENDDYGFCFDMEEEVATALDRDGGRLFRQHLESRFEEVFAPFAAEEPRHIHDYPAAVHMAARVLKRSYVGRRNLSAYLTLCERTLPSPKDCENIAEILIAKKRPEDALGWVEKGQALENSQRWGNQAAYGLPAIRQKLLKRLGRGGEARELAWSAFREHPSLYGYRELMEYVPRKERRLWSEKALQHAECTDLAGFIEVGLELKAWDALSRRILAVSDEALEGVSHYVNEPVAKALARRHPLAAAKIHCALAMRIVVAGKSKYYTYALEHLEQAKKLYEKNGQEESWQSLVARLRQDHSRKHSLMGGFEAIVAGRPTSRSRSFEQRMRTKWKKQSSK